MNRDKILQEAEDYQMFLREWKLNHPQQKQPTMEECKKWFRIKPDYQSKVNSNYDIKKKKKAFSKA